MSSVRTAALAAFVAGAALCPGLANAQVFRIVGPDGKVTFSDRAPSDAKAVPAQSVAIGASNGSPAASLPIELRRVAGQYPVTLYSAANCGPCDSARSYLRERGVPYTENTVSTREDFAALQRVSGTSNLPFMTIGAQHVPGFSEAEWSQYFDAAGYPKTSQLPASYRNPDPRPLVAVQQVTPGALPRAGAPQPQRAAEAPRAIQAPPAENPAGIRF
jgi:glutaredoxin